MAKVFISYSRTDSRFVRRLSQILDKDGNDTWVDFEDIPPTAEWLKEIFIAIEAADAFVFILSPDSVSSAICRKECNHASKLNKRLIPVLYKNVDPAKVPEPIRRVNWIEYKGDHDFKRLTDQLVKVVNTDLDWIRAHTQLLQQASEWEQKDHDRGLLLRGARLHEAEAWLAKVPEKEARPTSLQLRLITHSRKFAITVQRRIVAAALLGIIVAGALTAVAWFQRQEAVAQRQTAEHRLQVSKARELAAIARINLSQEARFLPLSVLLAVESMRRSPSLDAHMLLRTGLRLMSHPDRNFQHKGGANDIAFSPDGKSIASVGNDGIAQVWKIQDGSMRLILNHGRNVRLEGIMFSPDGKFIATSGWDGTARIWDSVSGEELVRMKHNQFTVDDRLIFDPSGQYLITNTYPQGKEATIWDIKNKKLHARLPHDSIITSVAIFPDGSRVVTGAQDDTVRVWSFKEGRQLQLFNHSSEVSDVAVSPNGKLIASVTDRLILWDAKTGRAVWKSPQMAMYISVVAFSSDGKLIATGGGDKIARVWNTETGDELRRFEHDGSITDVAFNSEGNYLATASDDFTARLFDLPFGKEIYRASYNLPVFRIRFSADNSYIATASQDGSVKVWTPIWRKKPAIWHEGPIRTIAFSHSGKYLSTASSDAGSDNSARIWEVSSNHQLSFLKHQSGVQAVAFSHDDRFLATAGEDGTAHVWEVKTSREVIRLRHDGQVRDVEFSPDSKKIATGSFDMTSRLFETESGKELAQVKHDKPVWSVSFSPDGQWVASASSSDSVKVWKSESGEVLITVPITGTIPKVEFASDSRRLAIAADNFQIWDVITGQGLVNVSNEGGDIVDIAFAPDGKTIATGDLAGRLRVWRSGDGEMLAEFIHEFAVLSVEFSPDGRFIGTGSEDRTARIWEISTEREVAREIHDNWVNAVAFSPDGRLFATGGQDWTARIFLWQPSDVIDEACRSVDRNLTKEEWQQYLGESDYRSTCPNLSVN